MPREEFPSTLELLGRYVGIRSDIRTKEGRIGYRQIIDDIRDLVVRWSLGNAQIHEFEDKCFAPGEGEPRAANLTIDVGDGDEQGIWYSHADVIHASGLYPQGVNPYHLRKSDKEGVYEGCGSLDMKIGMVASLKALYKLPEILKQAKQTKRKIRVLIVYGEEEDSCGINAARPLIRGSDWAISTEIAVQSKLGNNGNILYARPGRVHFEVEIEGLATSHMGGAHKVKPSHKVTNRVMHAHNKVDMMKLPAAPSDDPTMPASLCISNEYGIIAPTSYSISDKGFMKLEVVYTDPNLEVVDIEDILREKLQHVLKRGFTISTQKDRKTPWIKPWREDTNHPFIQAGVHEATKLLGRPPTLIWGEPVAEEGVFAEERIPMQVISPDGEDEHKGTEKVDVRYADTVMIPFLQRMAATDRSLTKEANGRI